MKTVFLKAITVSLLFHVVGFFLFNVKLSSHGLFYKKQTEVNFIGAILPLITGSQLTKVQIFKFPANLHRKKVEHLQGFFLTPLSKDETYRSGIPYKKSFLPDRARIIKTTSEFNPLLIRHPEKKNSRNTYNNLILQRNLKERKVMYKPEDSELRNLSLLYSDYGKIILEIKITPEGKVNEAVIIKTSGNPKIDITVKRYFKQWLFEPVLEENLEKGKIEFNLITLQNSQSQTFD